MSDIAFNAGDVVRLKSGGPTMTVKRTARDAHQEPMLECSWFTGPIEHKGEFPPAAVDKIR